jgi:hypothetical protein
VKRGFVVAFSRVSRRTASLDVFCQWHPPGVCGHLVCDVARLCCGLVPAMADASGHRHQGARACLRGVSCFCFHARGAPSNQDSVFQVKKAERNQDAINEAFRPRLSSASFLCLLPRARPRTVPARKSILTCPPRDGHDDCMCRDESLDDDWDD